MKLILALLLTVLAAAAQPTPEPPKPVIVRIDRSADGTHATLQWTWNGPFSTLEHWQIMRQRVGGDVEAQARNPERLKPVPVAGLAPGTTVLLYTFTDKRLLRGEAYQYWVVAIMEGEHGEIVNGPASKELTVKP